MLLVRSALALTLTACAPVREAPPVVPATPPPANVEQVVATRIPVAYADVRELARILRDLFDVRPDRGDVRVILADREQPALLVFATPAGLDALRRVLGPALAPTAAL